jgi:ABC-type antimicrobial peptide transport system permease subunit
LVDPTFSDISDSVIPPEVIEGLSTWMPDPIVLVEPVHYQRIRVDERMLTLLASEPTYWERVHRIKMIEGRMPSGLREAMVGEGGVTIYHWKIGQSLLIYGEPFTITGVYQAPGSEFSSVWITMTAADELFASKNPVQFLNLNLKPGADLEAVRQSLLESPLVAGRYAIFLEDSYTRRNARLVRDVYSVFNLISLMALLAIPLSTYSMTLLTLAERARALAVLRAVGFSYPAARAFLLLRALLLTVVAYGLGLVFAYLFNYLVELRGPVIIFDVLFKMRWTVEQGLIFFIITVIFAIAGAYFSSRRQMASSVSVLLKE